jgi:hypothetical protein
MNTDPREQLVEMGNKLLDLIYRRAEWERKNLDLVKLIERKQHGDDIPDAELIEMTSRPGLIEAIMEDLNLDAQYSATRSQYVLLRNTIESLDRPRVDLPDLGL